MKHKTFERIKVAGALLLAVVYLAACLIGTNVAANMYSDIISQTLGQATYVNVTEDGQELTDAEYFSSDYDDYDALRSDEMKLAQQIQEEGTVLLQNSGLPLSGPKSVTFLGIHSTQMGFFCGGNSSGSSPSYNAPTFTDAFTAAGYTVNTTMADYYDGLSMTSLDEPAVADFPADVRASISGFNELAVIVISRGGSEGSDVTRDILMMTDNERALVDLALENFEQTVVLLNTANNPDCSYLEGKDLSILWVGTPGDMGIGIVPQILLGEVNPSGHLVDTIVYDLNSAPASYSYGELNMFQEDGETELAHGRYLNYYENIYMGYRYYETRYADVVTGRPNVGSFDYAGDVTWPFGFGLSYTTFGYSDFDVSESGGTITAKVTVTNTGAVAGKDAVQIYMQSPYTRYDMDNGVEKSAIQLVGFAKTDYLAPGASAEVSVEISKEEMKAYDANNAKTYIVDDGDYYFAVGHDVHDALNNILASQGYSVSDGMTADGDGSLTGVVTQESFDSTTYAAGVDGVQITNQFDDVDLRTFLPDIVYISRNDWEGTYPTVRGGDLIGNAAMLAETEVTYEHIDESAMPTTGAENGLTLIQLKGRDYDDPMWEDLLDQLTPEELMYSYTHGGYMTSVIESIIKPPSVDVDGTSKINGTLIDGSECFVFMGECLVASTWNVDILERQGYYFAQDSLMVGVNGWYAPGMNMHRLPTAGRNPDYYSEDPFLAGKLAASIVRSGVDNGLVSYIKHFALNDQETRRSWYSTFAPEQAVRELYLKPFEMAIREGGANGLMSSMNYVGLKSANYNSNLLVNVLRGEWGFKGVVITDASWNGSSRDMLLNGTDLILNPAAQEIPDYSSDTAVMNALRQAVHRICYSFVNSNLMNGFSPATRQVAVTPAWRTALTTVNVVLGVVLAGTTVLAVSFIIKGKKGNEK